MKLLEITAKSQHPMIGILLHKLVNKGANVLLKQHMTWDAKAGRAIEKPFRYDIAYEVTDVELMELPDGSEVTRIYFNGPEEWVDLNPDDDEELQLKKNEQGEWILSAKGGKGMVI